MPKIIYHILSIAFKQTIPIFFRKIIVTGKKNIHSNDAIIIVSNHPNAFMDAFILGYLSKKSIHSLVRGDVFKNPIIGFMLKQLNLIPIYRAKDGFRNVYKNINGFLKTYPVLKKNGRLIIFPEGQSVQKKSLQKLRKGAARLALSACMDLEKNVLIVPVSINYMSLNKKEGIMVHVSKPILANQYIAEYNQNNARAISKLTIEIQSQIEQGLIIQKEGTEVFAEKLLAFYRNASPDNETFGGYAFLTEKKICAAVNTERITTEFEELFAQYQDHLQLAKTTDRVIAYDENTSTTPFNTLLLPLSFIGYLFNFMPFLLGQTAQKTIVTDKEYGLAINLSVSVISYFLLWLGAVVFFFNVFSIGMAIILSLLIPGLGALASNWTNFTEFQSLKSQTNVYRTENPEEYQVLKLFRADLYQKLMDLL